MVTKHFRVQVTFSGQSKHPFSFQYLPRKTMQTYELPVIKPICLSLRPLGIPFPSRGQGYEIRVPLFSLLDSPQSMRHQTDPICSISSFSFFPCCFHWRETASNLYRATICHHHYRNGNGDRALTIDREWTLLGYLMEKRAFSFFQFLATE